MKRCTIGAWPRSPDSAEELPLARQHGSGSDYVSMCQ